jgi:hypothetical protein
MFVAYGLTSPLPSGEGERTKVRGFELLLPVVPHGPSPSPSPSPGRGDPLSAQDIHPVEHPTPSSSLYCPKVLYATALLPCHDHFPAS